MFDMYCSHFGCLAQFIRDYPKSTAKVNAFTVCPASQRPAMKRLRALKSPYNLPVSAGVVAQLVERLVRNEKGQGFESPRLHQPSFSFRI